MTDESRDVQAVRALLTYQFGLVREYVEQVCAGVDDEQAVWRPDPEANSVSWLCWHLSRVQDDHICGITGQEQVWKRDGWYDRFDVPFDASDTGYGHEPDDVAKVKAGPDLLDGYHAAVHAMTLEYIDTITKDELARVVDERWDPPVTASVRLCSILGDCLAHLGQADYVRGLAERAGGRSSA